MGNQFLWGDCYTYGWLVVLYNQILLFSYEKWRFNHNLTMKHGSIIWLVVKKPILKNMKVNGKDDIPCIIVKNV